MQVQVQQQAASQEESHKSPGRHNETRSCSYRAQTPMHAEGGLQNWRGQHNTPRRSPGFHQGQEHGLIRLVTASKIKTLRGPGFFLPQNRHGPLESKSTTQGVPTPSRPPRPLQSPSQQADVPPRDIEKAQALTVLLERTAAAADAAGWQGLLEPI